jgi:hypothetical protein
LAVGDRLIVEGMLKVRPGNGVKVVPLQSATATGQPQAESGSPAASQK